MCINIQSLNKSNHNFMWYSCTFNSHMHKMGPWEPKHYIFDDQFYSKNAIMLRFHVFVHDNARKYMISSYYLKCNKFTIFCEFVSPEDQSEQKKSHFVYLMEHFLFWIPRNPFHAVKLQKYFKHMTVKDIINNFK